MATIGITIPESVWSARSERYYTQVLHGLEDAAVAGGHTVLSRVTGSSEEELEVLAGWAERGMVDVVILKDLLADDLEDPRVRSELLVLLIADTGEIMGATRPGQ